MPIGELIPQTKGPSPFGTEVTAAITQIKDHIKIINWNINTWVNIKPYNRPFIMDCDPDVLLIQEPRIVACLPNYTTIQSQENCKINSAILIKNNIPFK